MLFSPAVGPLFPADVALFYPLCVLRCWCCCGLLFVLDCPDLCPLHVLTHVFITERSLTCYAWSGSPQPHSEEDSSPLQALCVEVSDPRARLATLSSAWSWIPQCHVWSTFARRWNCLVVGVCASKVCTQTTFCTFHQALLCSASRDRALVCSGSSCFRRHPSQVINLSTDTIVPAVVPVAFRLDLAVSASASGARSRQSSVRVVPAHASAYDTRSRSCPRCVLAVCLVVSGHPAHPAPRPVAAREKPIARP